MKDFLRAQLERHAQRLNELDFLLSREDIMKDMTQFLALSREHTDVTATAGRYGRYQQREADAQAAQQMLQDGGDDADMRAMAEEEIASAEAELLQLEAELQRMLLPKDPDDARPAFIEQARVAMNLPCLPQTCYACTCAMPSAKGGAPRS
jgi:peptide chain release factor 1